MIDCVLIFCSTCYLMKWQFASKIFTAVETSVQDAAKVQKRRKEATLINSLHTISKEVIEILILGQIYFLKSVSIQSKKGAPKGTVDSKTCHKT